MQSRHYAGLMMASTMGLALLIVLLSWAWIRQPQTGDLARIGGYVEALYESRSYEPRMAFEQPLFASFEDHEDGNFDVLVLGDSFSYTGGRYNWVSHFVAQTGLRVRVASIHRWWEVWLDLEAKGAFPPMVILQSVERDVVDHLANINHRLKLSAGHRSQTSVASPRPPALPGPLQGLTRSPLPPKTFTSFDERVSVTVDVLWKSLRRRVGIPRREVVVFTLDTGKPAVFSSIERRFFMTIPADLKSRSPAPRRWQQAIEGIGRLRSLLSATANSHLALLVVPNRLSVYGPQLVDFAGGPTNSPAERLALEAGSLDSVGLLRASVDSGVQDVFWAMDTHLSAVGADILARGFIEWLQREGYQGYPGVDSVIKSAVSDEISGQ